MGRRTFARQQDARGHRMTRTEADGLGSFFMTPEKLDRWMALADMVRPGATLGE